MKPNVIVLTPQSDGRRINPEALCRHYGLRYVKEYWDGQDSLPAGDHLVYTSAPLDSLKIPPNSILTTLDMKLVDLPLAATIPPAPDANVRALQQLLGQRSEHGLAKYGTTTERTDLSLRDWLQHQLEELCDAAVYAKSAIARLDEETHYRQKLVSLLARARAGSEAAFWVIAELERILEGAPAAHPDDVAVDNFAAALKVKLSDARAKGRNGWDDPEQCENEDLSDMLRKHVEKGDPRDVAAFCCFLWNRGEPIR